MLALSCDGLTDCALTARAPKDGAQIWKLALPGIGRVLAGVNNDLLGTRLLSGTYDDAVEASPGRSRRCSGSRSTSGCRWSTR